MTPKQKRFLWIAGSVFGTLAVISVLFVLTRAAFLRESEQRGIVRDYGDKKAQRCLNIFVTISDVDPLKATATARVVFDPRGALADDQGNPTQDLKLYCNTLSGDQDHIFKKGHSMAPFEMTMNLFDGQAYDYPFDKFSTELEFQLSVYRGREERDPTLVPAHLYVTANVAGLKLTPGETKEKTSGYVSVDFLVTRSDTTLATAVFGMGVMWAIGLSVLSLTVNILLTHEHLNTLTFLSGLLFALFSFRNSLPGTPPVGTLSDFIAFFWVEGIVSMSLVVVVVLNIFKRTNPLGGEVPHAEADVQA